jgi:hypothetical protein
MLDEEKEEEEDIKGGENWLTSLAFILYGTSSTMPV